MDRAADQAICRPITTAVIWLRQIQYVKNVKHLDAELRLYPLSDRRVLDDREIYGLEARAIELVSLGVPKGALSVPKADLRTGRELNLRALLWKCAGVEPLETILDPSCRLHDTAERVAQEVRPVLFVTGVTIVESGEDAEGEAAVIGHERRKLPSFGQPGK